MSFDGQTYEAGHDEARLSRQLDLVKNLMLDGVWRTLEEIGAATQAPPASVSARLRDLRKAKHGGFLVERRARGERDAGLFEYRVIRQEQPVFGEKGQAPNEVVIPPSQEELESFIVWLRGVYKEYVAKGSPAPFGVIETCKWLVALEKKNKR